MTDSDHAIDAIERAASRLLPQLTERLERHGLAEIEVTDGDLRLRVRGSARSATRPTEPAGAQMPAASAGRGTSEGPSVVGVSSPAVGFFVYADGLGPGLTVAKGEALGHIEMLGVRHDVRAPRRGTVRHLVAESGEAVEYGQVVVEMDPDEASR